MHELNYDPVAGIPFFSLGKSMQSQLVTEATIVTDRKDSDAAMMYHFLHFGVLCTPVYQRMLAKELAAVLLQHAELTCMGS